MQIERSGKGLLQDERIATKRQSLWFQSRPVGPERDVPAADGRLVARDGLPGRHADGHRAVAAAWGRQPSWTHHRARRTGRRVLLLVHSQPRVQGQCQVRVSVTVGSRALAGEGLVKAILTVALRSVRLRPRLVACQGQCGNNHNVVLGRCDVGFKVSHFGC